jgi:hypothetical protein
MLDDVRISHSSALAIGRASRAPDFRVIELSAGCQITLDRAVISPEASVWRSRRRIFDGGAKP